MDRLIIGPKPFDDGHYIFDEEERAAFLEAEPDAESFLRPFIGAREYLQGGKRWILTLHDAQPEKLARLPRVKERIASVRAYRLQSKSIPTRKLAETPTLYHVNVIPAAPFLVIPEVGSERREYAPIGWLEPPTIPSNLVRILNNASLTDFALLTSAMHMAWLRHIGGRLKSDYGFPAWAGIDALSMRTCRTRALRSRVLRIDGLRTVSGHSLRVCNVVDIEHVERRFAETVFELGLIDPDGNLGDDIDRELVGVAGGASLTQPIPGDAVGANQGILYSSKEIRK